MKTNMILSASGWRKVFAISGDEQDKTALIGEENIAISVASARVFSDYVKEKSGKNSPSVIVGMDARPTGSAISEAAIKAFLKCGIEPVFLGITAAPEIMAYSRGADGFMYISASHNPVGHNGIKFGLSDGGVLEAKENAILTENFTNLIEKADGKEENLSFIENFDEGKVASVYKKSEGFKKKALISYQNFLKETITGTKIPSEQEKVLFLIKEGVKSRSIGIVCDMNGSARTVSVDKDFFESLGINFYAINNKPGLIAHEIIPESENLIYVAEEMKKLQKEGKKDAILGYMPDCDGDRGNIVYWDEEKKESVILKAQEVFSLSVLSELSYSFWKNENPEFTKNTDDFKSAVAVNCPTSMRINEICKAFGATLFRAEVGEANVVHLAQEKRNEGYDVRILGEGSNGGTITHPSCVRDPINTIFAFIKLLSIREMYSLWCKKNGTEEKENYTLTDVLSSIPKYTTTGVSEKRALLKISTTDHSILKGKFQKIFEKQWNEKKDFLSKYGISGWEAVRTNGTKEVRNEKDFSESKKGGLKILFKDKHGNEDSFIWMRGSGTEPVFRIMCDVKGDNPEKESELLSWETEMLLEADK